MDHVLRKYFTYQVFHVLGLVVSQLMDLKSMLTDAIGLDLLADMTLAMLDCGICGASDDMQEVLGECQSCSAHDPERKVFRRCLLSLYLHVVHVLDLRWVRSTWRTSISRLLRRRSGAIDGIQYRD